jgi:hypothetical protein
MAGCALLHGCRTRRSGSYRSGYALKRSAAVPDDIWAAAAKYYNEAELAALILSIAQVNLWNRLNVATRQVAGEWAKFEEAQKSLKERTA